MNCGHYPMVFIPGVSTIKTDPQSPEENAETYAESQQQRALERKLREEKRELEIMKAQGAPDEEIRAQRAKVRRASSDIDAFCDETGRTRRRANEYTPVNASWEGAKVPPYGVPVENVINQYRVGSKPGVGTLSREHGEKQKVKQHEIDVSNELIRTFGGNITLIDNAGRDSRRDLVWKGKIYEVKRASTISASREQTKEGMHKISITGGNFIIDCWDDDFDTSTHTVLHNVERYFTGKSIDVVIMQKGVVAHVFRYKKR